MSKDMIADFLTIIRNGIRASKTFVVAPYSQMRKAIADILKHEGFIRDFLIEEDVENRRQYIKIILKYVDNESVIHEISRSSKSSRRYYAGVKNIKPVIGGLGISILSTNQGIITNKQAKELGIGGEILCVVW